MAYRLVRGQFIVIQSNGRRSPTQPDGDSVRFKPDRPELLEGLDGRDAEFNKYGTVQTRFEGVDALELHYAGAHQAFAAAAAARDFTLQEIGFPSVTFSQDNGIVVSTAEPPAVPGYLLTRNVDPYGRPVVFVFGGSTNRPDGDPVWLDARLVEQSVNARLMKAGHVYPAFYTDLPVDLRDRLSELCSTAWNKDKGLWPADTTTAWTRIRNLPDLQERVIWPKLFRRLTDYFGDVPQGLSQFDGWLRADAKRDDQLWIIPNAELANLHDVIEVSGDRLRMRFWPEELFIVPR